MRRFSSIKTFRIVLALAVAFWMAGAGCMLGCENMLPSLITAEAKTSSVTLVASGSACASMGSHDCCAHHQSAANKSHNTGRRIAGATELGATPSSMVDCPLAGNAFAELSKSRSENNSSSADQRTNLFLPALALVRGPELAPSFSPPNRGHTYLRCCVFLI
jgi:hypothetical protein